MKKLLASTALVLAIAAPFGASAQNAATGVYVPSVENAMRASALMGKNIYVSEADVAMDPVAEASGDWNNVGEINDIILGTGGDVQAVLVDVGGFLGIGEKTVAVNLADIRMVPDSASPDNFFLVFKGNKGELENAPAFQMTANGAAMKATDGTMTTDTAANGTAATDGTTAGMAADATATTANNAAAGTATDTTATTPANTAAATDTMATPEGMQVADLGKISADKLIGADVRGADNADVGEVGDLVMDGDKLSAVVVDVGGFLGIGEKPVALNLDQVKVWQDQSGTLVVSVSDTKDALKALPTYKKP